MDRRRNDGPRGVVRYVIMTWVPEDMLAEWNDWHNRVHIPHVMAAPQMKSVRKFRAPESTGDLRFRPQYMTIYELASMADFEAYRSGPGVAMKREYEERYGSIGKIARMVLVETPLDQVRPISTPDDLMVARSLFEEYASALGFDLSFQGFDKELKGLPGDYAPPGGAILLAFDGNLVQGCVALRPMEKGICEMKRLYVRPAARGTRLGRLLAETIMGEARAIGYARMRLDTLPTMREAIRLYRSLGFVEIAPYYESPVVGALFMERSL